MSQDVYNDQYAKDSANLRTPTSQINFEINKNFSN